MNLDIGMPCYDSNPWSSAAIEELLCGMFHESFIAFCSELPLLRSLDSLGQAVLCYLNCFRVHRDASDCHTFVALCVMPRIVSRSVMQALPVVTGSEDL